MLLFAACATSDDGHTLIGCLQVEEVRDEAGVVSGRCESVESGRGVASISCTSPEGSWYRGDRTWDAEGCMTSYNLQFWSDADGYSDLGWAYTCDDAANPVTLERTWRQEDGEGTELHRFDNTYADGVLVGVEDWLQGEDETLAETRSYTWDGAHLVGAVSESPGLRIEETWRWDRAEIARYAVVNESEGESTEQVHHYRYDDAGRLLRDRYESGSYEEKTVYAYTGGWPGPTSASVLTGDEVVETHSWTYECPGAPGT